MALQRGYGDGVTVTGASSQRGPRTFWLPGGGDTTVVMLDGDPVEIVRHQLFLKGDKVAARMRQTCFGMNPREHPEPCPRQCLVCNKSLSSPRQIGRKMLLCSTLIDERAFVWQGKDFKDMKLLLELPQDAADGWRQQKAALGEIRFRRFRVYRSKAAPGKPQTSARHGDKWYDLGSVDPVRHFWNSPAIKALMDAASRRGEPIDHMTAVTRLVTPIAYETEIGVYKAAEAEAFVAYLEGRTGAAGPRQAFNVPAGAAPPPPPSSQPSYGAPPAPPGGYQPPAAPPGPVGQPTFGAPAVPPGNIPTAPQVGQPPTAPAASPPAAPAASPPPPVPDPVAAGGEGGFAGGGYAPPPMPPAGTIPGGVPAAPAAPTEPVGVDAYAPTPPWTPPVPAPAGNGFQGVQPMGLPPLPGAGIPQEGVNRIPAGIPPGASMPTPGAMAPPGVAPAPAPPAGFPGAVPAPVAAGGGYSPPMGPPQGGPVQGPAPAAAPAAAPVPVTAPPGAGFDFSAGFNPNAAPGVPPLTDPAQAGMF